MRFNSRTLTLIMEKIIFRLIYQFLIPGLFTATQVLDISSPQKVSAFAEKAPWSCLFLKFTGWECPGCGMTRSLLSFFALDIPGSFRFNLFGPLVGLALVAAWAWSFWAKDFSIDRVLRLFPRRAAWPTLFVLIGWGIFRNFGGALHFF